MANIFKLLLYTNFVLNDDNMCFQILLIDDNNYFFGTALSLFLGALTRLTSTSGAIIAVLSSLLRHDVSLQVLWITVKPASNSI